jgi:probable blue pigment (indigoidine) exporter
VAVDLSGPTIAGFVTPLYAVAAALLAVPILGERMRPVTLVAFALAIAGTALLAGFDPRGVAWSGIVVAIIAALAFGLYIVLARRWGRPYGLDGTTVTMANLASRGPLLLAVEAVRAPAGLLPSEPDPSALVAILAIAFGASSTANLLLIAGVRRVPAGRASAALLLAPLSSAAIGVLLLGERLTPVEIAGAALNLAGIAGAERGRGWSPARTIRQSVGIAGRWTWLDSASRSGRRSPSASRRSSSSWTDRGCSGPRSSRQAALPMRCGRSPSSARCCSASCRSRSSSSHSGMHPRATA